MDYSVDELRQHLTATLDRLQGLNIPSVVNELKLMNTGAQHAWQNTNDPDMQMSLAALHRMTDLGMDIDLLHDQVVSGFERKRAVL